MTEPVMQLPSHVTQEPVMNTAPMPAPAGKLPMLASTSHKSQTRYVSPNTYTVTQEN